MMLLARQQLWIACGVALCLLGSEGDAAGKKGNSAGRGAQMHTRVELATLPEVQADLKLNDEQKKFATDQLTRLREQRQKAKGESDKGKKKQLAKAKTEGEAQLIAKLDETQRKRLNGLMVQVNGPTALLDPAIAQSLNFDEAFNSKLKEAGKANQEARREVTKEQAGNKPKERRAAMKQLREKEEKTLLAMMSDDQKKQLEAFKGPALEINLSPLKTARSKSK
jgi:hypothetical protein